MLPPLCTECSNECAHAQSHESYSMHAPDTLQGWPHPEEQTAASFSSMLVCRLAAYRPTGSSIKAFATFSRRVALSATSPALLRLARTATPSSRRCSAPAVTAMESSKVRTALEEMDDKGDGAFKVRLPWYSHVAAPEPAALAFCAQAQKIVTGG